MNREKGKTSRGNTDISTKLAPQENSILCRQTQILLQKREKNIYREGN